MRRRRLRTHHLRSPTRLRLPLPAPLPAYCTDGRRCGPSQPHPRRLRPCRSFPHPPSPATAARSQSQPLTQPAAPSRRQRCHSHRPRLRQPPRSPWRFEAPTARHDTQASRPGGRASATDAPSTVLLDGATPARPVQTTFAPAVAVAAPVAASEPATPVHQQVFAALVPIRGGKSGEHQLTVQLHPAELGPVSIVARFENGELSVTLASGSDAAREALQSAHAAAAQRPAAGGIRRRGARFGRRRRPGTGRSPTGVPARGPTDFAARPERLEQPAGRQPDPQSTRRHERPGSPAVTYTDQANRANEAAL